MEGAQLWELSACTCVAGRAPSKPLLAASAFVPECLCAHVSCVAGKMKSLIKCGACGKNPSSKPNTERGSWQGTKVRRISFKQAIAAVGTLPFL